MNQAVKVSSLATAKHSKRRYDAVLTVEDPGMRNGLRFHRTPHPDHLILMFEDVDDPVPGVALPHERHVEAALAFGREHAQGSVLVHCRAGVARSAALGLAIIADRLGPGMEREAVERLLRARPVAIPNLIVLGMADRLLGRSGRLVGAWLEVEASHPQYAEHRNLKRRMFAANPSLYAAERPLASTAFRCLPHALVPAPVMAAGQDAGTSA